MKSPHKGALRESPGHHRAPEAQQDQRFVGAPWCREVRPGVCGNGPNLDHGGSRLAGLCRREIAPARLFNDPASDLPTTARGHPSTSHSPRQRPPSPPWAAAPATARSAAATASRRRATRPAASASRVPVASAAAVPAPAAVGAPASHGRCRPRAPDLLPALDARPEAENPGSARRPAPPEDLDSTEPLQPTSATLDQLLTGGPAQPRATAARSAVAQVHAVRERLPAGQCVSSLISSPTIAPGRRR